MARRWHRLALLTGVLVGACGRKSTTDTPAATSSAASTTSSPSPSNTGDTSNTSVGPTAMPSVDAGLSSPIVLVFCAKIDSLTGTKDESCPEFFDLLRKLGPDEFSCIRKCADESKNEGELSTCGKPCAGKVTIRLGAAEEAKRVLAKVERASRDKYQQETSVGPDGVHLEHVFCGVTPFDSGGSPQPADVPNGKAIGDYRGNVWKCLKFSLPEQLCQYAYESSGKGPAATYRATALCDPDASGSAIRVVLKGKIMDGEPVRESLTMGAANWTATDSHE